VVRNHSRAAIGAALVGVVAGASCAWANPYITVDLLARPAELDASRYTVANGSGGYTSLAGYKPSAPGTLTDTVGYTSVITAASVGQAFELLVRLTMAPEGTTNPYAPSGFTSIINLNPSGGANGTGINSLVFNLGQDTSGTQVNFLQANQGPAFVADPDGDGSSPPVLDPVMVIDRSRNAGSGGLWDATSGYKGGTPTNRGNGFNDVFNAALLRPPGVFSGVGGTIASPTIVPQNAAVSYFTIGSLNGASTVGINFNGLDLNSPDGPIAAIIGSVRWRDAGDTTNISYQITSTAQAASVAGNDPLIKINSLSIQQSSGPVPAAILVNPAGGTLGHGDHVTVTNTAAGGSVDPATLSNLSIATTLANGTWSQVGLANDDIAGNGGSQVNTVSATFNANTLSGAKLKGTLSFDVAGKTIAASSGAGPRSFALSATNIAPAAPVGSGTTFGAAQTAAIEANSQLRDAPLSSSPETSPGTVMTLADSTASASFVMATVEWRHRSNLELNGDGTPDHPALISDVFKVTLGSASPAAYVLQLTYDPSSYSPSAAADAFTSGKLYIARMTPGGDNQNGTFDDVWDRAGAGLPDTFNIRPYVYTDLNNIGSYGIDTAAHLIWTVLDGNSQGQFAMVPEPGSLSLLAAGALVLLQRKRR
jgi:hypothetical protein